MNYVLLIAVGLLAFFLGRKMGKKGATPNQMSDIRGSAHAALSKRTEDRKEAILKELSYRKELDDCKGTEKEGVTRLEVEKLLEVSNDTALKYLNELEDEEKVLQVGLGGNKIYYILK
ncbi:hypothetical protein COB52_03470 [Candidatus Kaiserbacteria bacterium]|nr:MAG: hypothetical protein COB52_03470 [Candidatus Kaiserbacteria bacterium]